MQSAFAARVNRSLLHYGCEFADFVPARAEGCWLYDAAGKLKLWTSANSYLLVQAELLRLDREDAGWKVLPHP